MQTQQCGISLENQEECKMEDIRQLSQEEVTRTLSTADQTAQADVLGATTGTLYPLGVVNFLKEIVEAGKKRMFFEQIVKRVVAPAGTKDIVIPVKTVFFGYNGTVGMRVDTTERTAADITFTELDNLDGVTLTPAIQLAGIAITNHALRTNALNLLDVAKEELTYAISDKVDQAIRDALVSNGNASTSGARGAQTVYGGDARSDAELATGDTLTTDMIAEAKRKLQSTVCKYWDPTSPQAEASSSETKNPWRNTPDAPFVLLLAPEQEEVLLTDSQFVNAAEYGSAEVVLNGEIGKYLGVKIVVANNVTLATTSDTSPDATGTPGADMHRCIMVKSQKCGAIAYGQEPKLTPFPFPTRAQQRLIIESAYQSKALYKDAIVFVDVSDT